MLRTLLDRLRALLNLPLQAQSDRRRIQKEIERGLKEVQRSLKRQREASDRRANQQEAAVDALAHELRAVRGDSRKLLLQYHLQLARLTYLLEGRAGAPEAYAAAIPLTADAT